MTSLPQPPNDDRSSSGPPALLLDRHLFEAAQSMSLRAEQNRDPQRTQLFVDLGVIGQLRNTNHQLLYGRRGRGRRTSSGGWPLSSTGRVRLRSTST